MSWRSKLQRNLSSPEAHIGEHNAHFARKVQAYTSELEDKLAKLAAQSFSSLARLCHSLQEGNANAPSFIWAISSSLIRIHESSRG